MKKRIIFIIVIILMIFLIGFVLYKNNNNGRKETIALVKKIFGINIQDFEFEYQNELEKKKYDGALVVKMIMNADQLEEFLNKWDKSEAGFKLSTWEDDITIMSNFLDLDAGEGEIYSRLSGVKRKIWFAGSKPKTIFSFVYFLENDDSSTTIYMGYLE